MLLFENSFHGRKEWPGRLPRGELHSLKGDQMEGKEHFEMWGHCLPRKDMSHGAGEETLHPEA